MEWFIGVAAVVLVGIVIVGLFHGPSHRAPHRPRQDTSPVLDLSASTAPLPDPRAEQHGHAAGETAPEPPAYVLPPPPRRRVRVGRRSPSRPRGRRS